MPLAQSEGFVLKTFNVGEQDKIVVFFSRDKGLFKGIAKGARKFGNRFGSSLEPMSHIRVFYYEKEGKDLVVVNSCDLIESFFEVHKDLETTFHLSYFSELIEQFFPLWSKDDTLFRLLLSILRALKNGEDVNFLGIYFEIWLLKISGILPRLNQCKKCKKEISDSGWLSLKKDGALCSRCSPQKKVEIKPELISLLRWIKKILPLKEKILLFHHSKSERSGKPFRLSSFFIWKRNLKAYDTYSRPLICHLYLSRISSGYQ